MPLLLFFLTTSLATTWSSGCAQTGACPPGHELVDDECIPDEPPETPDPQTKQITAYCNFSPDSVPDNEPVALTWELTVEPLEPIVAGESFGTRLRGGGAAFSAAFMNDGEVLVPGGFTRSALLEFNWTVHVRRGAIDPEDVSFMLEPIETTCTYDDDGNTGPDAGPFPSCDGDDDCTGLGGAPDPQRNPCLPFVEIATSRDCDPDGVCDGLGATGPDSPCELNGFCASGPVEFEFEEVRQAYTADSAGSVLFGWADESTGATIEEEGPNQGTWILPEAVFGEDPGPNGFRVTVAGVPFAFECTMGVPCRLQPDLDCRDPLSSPTPDSQLISFPIQER